MDMPAIADFAAQIDFAKVSEKIADYRPAIEIIKSTWDKSTLEEIAGGRVIVPDDVINERLAEFAKDNESVESVFLESVGDGRFKLMADTKKTGRVELLCRIEEFVHNESADYIKVKVLEKSLPDHGTMSWIFSRLSLSMT